MASRDWHDDNKGEYDDDPDNYGPGNYDSDDDDGLDTMPCPECRATLPIELDHCPRCGHWLTAADRDAQDSGLFSRRYVRWFAAAMLAIFLLSLAAELALFQ